METIDPHKSRFGGHPPSAWLRFAVIGSMYMGQTFATAFVSHLLPAIYRDQGLPTGSILDTVAGLSFRSGFGGRGRRWSIARRTVGSDRARAGFCRVRPQAC